MRFELMDDNKRRHWSAALSQIERQFGKGAIMKMGINLWSEFHRFQPDHWDLILLSGLVAYPMVELWKSTGQKAQGKPL